MLTSLPFVPGDRSTYVRDLTLVKATAYEVTKDNWVFVFRTKAQYPNFSLNGASKKNLDTAIANPKLTVQVAFIRTLEDGFEEIFLLSPDEYRALTKNAFNHAPDAEDGGYFTIPRATILAKFGAAVFAGNTEVESPFEEAPAKKAITFASEVAPERAVCLVLNDVKAYNPGATTIASKLAENQFQAVVTKTPAGLYIEPYFATSEEEAKRLFSR